jgi:DNA invertase Pin-like site-specific DNA recombinase
MQVSRLRQTLYQVGYKYSLWSLSPDTAHGEHRQEMAVETTVKPKAVGYIRVSTNRQADNGYGLDAQREQITRFCVDNGLELVALIPDVMSGKRTDKLYGRIAAITAIRTGMANVLVVNTLDRSSRSMADGAKLVADARPRDGASSAWTEPIATQCLN